MNQGQTNTPGASGLTVPDDIGEAGAGLDYSHTGSSPLKEFLVQVVSVLDTLVALKGSTVYSKTVTITKVADLAGLGVGVKTFDKNLGTVLPVGAVLVLQPIVPAWVGFDDATHAAVTAIIGTTVGGHDVSGAAQDVDVTNATGLPGAFAGAGSLTSGMAFAGTQMHVRIASTVDLRTITTGSITFTVYYTVPAAG